MTRFFDSEYPYCEGGNFASVLCLLEIKMLIKMVLGKFREHPVLLGNEVVDENGTRQISRASCDPVLVGNEVFDENGTGQISRASCAWWK